MSAKSSTTPKPPQEVDPLTVLESINNWLEVVSRPDDADGRKTYDIVKNAQAAIDFMIRNAAEDNDEAQAQGIITDQLRAEVVDLPAEIRILERRQPQEATPRRSEKHPDAPMFRGKKEEYKTFVKQLEMKLLMNKDWYPSLTRKLGYAYSRLEGPAADQFASHVKCGTLDLISMERFYEILKNAFGDPDEKRTAQRKLRELRQGRKTFAEFHAEF